mgnify:CR=1 FL=1
MESVTHFVIDASTGEEVDLNRSVEVEGFKAGDRIRYGGRCFSAVFGKEAVVMGFTENSKSFSGWMIWTMPDGQTGCHWTPAQFASRDLIKI